MNTELIFKIVLGALYVGLAVVWVIFQRRAGAYDDGMKSHARAQRQHEAAPLVIARPVLGIGWHLAVLVRIFFPAWIGWAALPLSDLVRIGGAVMAGLALALLGWSMDTLGRNFLATLQLASDHTLVTGGPYRRMRHPMYLALLLYHIGICSLSANWLIGLLGVGLIAVVSLVRMPREEAMLAERFGNEYRSYADQTGGLLPKLG